MPDEPTDSANTPGSDAAAGQAPAMERGKCPYCLTGIAGGEDKETCPGCRAIYHRECWTENGGCAVYGCSCVPVVEARRAIEVPNAFWGQENKPCPSCGQQILAAAVRCRHCGATFGSAQPQNTAEFLHRSAVQERLPEVRRLVTTIFVLSIIPFSAPVGAVWGHIYRRQNQTEIAALPPLYQALHKIGLGASQALTIAMLVMTIIYVAVRGGGTD